MQYSNSMFCILPPSPAVWAGGGHYTIHCDGWQWPSVCGLLHAAVLCISYQVRDSTCENVL